MKKNKFITMIMVGILSACSGIGVLNGTAYAGANTMTVSPPHQKVILVPGETYRNSISIFNASHSQRDLKYAVEVGSFSQHKSDDSKDDYGAIDHVSKSSYNQIMDWIKLDNTEGKLKPGETAEIGYSIEVPETAPGGGQYATILAIDKTDSDLPKNGNVSIDQTFQFASIIYAEVAGETKQDGQILENSIPGFLLKGDFVAGSMVRNNGNVHTDAEYTLQVWPLFSDEEICTNEEEPETSLILPETEKYHTQNCELPSVGIFKAKQVVKIFGEESMVEKMVIVCPLWLLFIIFFVIAVVIIWLIMQHRARKQRKNERKSA